MKTIIIALSMSAALWPAQAGTLTGTIRAEGKTPPTTGQASGNYQSRKYKFVERINYAELRDFVVYIDGPVGTAPATPLKSVVVETRRVAQQGAVFTPHVLPIVAGTCVEWPNNDEIFHNVFSMSENKQFDLDLYKGNPPDKKVVFDKAGRVDVFCSIHANMHCIVLVCPNPYFAVADESGHYSITNVPPGKYQLKAWHERLPAMTTEIVVPETGDVRTDFVLGIKDLPKY